MQVEFTIPGNPVGKGRPQFSTFNGHITARTPQQTGANDHPGGVKHDEGKVRLELVPPAAVMAIGRVMTYGAGKYGANNWQGVEIERYNGALLRHLYAWMAGEETDPESGMPHLWHVLTNSAFMVALDAGGDKNEQK